MDWKKYKKLHPDYIGNNPGVKRCQGYYLVSRTGKRNVRSNCQLRIDHDKDCINFASHKQWTKGVKKVIWEQLELDLTLQNSTITTEPVLSEDVLKALSQLE